MASPNITGRIALVTGASRGIGRAIAQRLASAGATVVVAARSLDRPTAHERAKPDQPLPGTLRETVALIEQAGGKAIAVAVDLEDPAQRDKMIERATAAAGGPITILINNAGFSRLEPIEVMSMDTFDRTVDQYFRTTFALSKAAIPAMRAAGCGWIVNISSVTALPAIRPYPKVDPSFLRSDGVVGGGAVYSAIKAAINRFSQGLAEEVVHHNIAVNVVAPSTVVWTPGAAEFIPPDLETEDPAYIAETVLAMCYLPAVERTGLLAYSVHYPRDEKIPVMSLDGKTRMPEMVPPKHCHPAIVPAGSGRAYD